MDKHNKGIFRESGWKADVEILENNSNSEWEKYKLKVVKTLRESRIFKTPADGHEFEVSAKQQYRGMVDWSLEVVFNG